MNMSANRHAATRLPGTLAFVIASTAGAQARRISYDYFERLPAGAGTNTVQVADVNDDGNLGICQNEFFGDGAVSIIDAWLCILPCTNAGCR